MRKDLYLIIYINFLICSCSMLIIGCKESLTVNHGDKDGQAYIIKGDTTYRGNIRQGKYHGFGVLTIKDSIVYAGQWVAGKRQGKGIANDSENRKITGRWHADTLVSGMREDSSGIYRGSFNKTLNAYGHGIYEDKEGGYYEGHWKDNQLNGQGFSLTANSHLKVGEWRKGKHLGERVKYTSERIYGIDISKYQHIIGKRKYPIHWDKLRIVHLGDASKKTISGKVHYPVSFIYIKSTEGATLMNPFYKADYRAARAHGFKVGTYHFFSIHSSAEQQAYYFLKMSNFQKGDFPPVLDVEPSHAQIAKMGGPEVLFARIRTWMQIVEKRIGVKPILYISQIFVNRYLPLAPDIKKNYNVWIARYGEYKPDVRLVYWQLSQDGRVNGIRGYVDINVFNGYQDVFNDFIKSQTTASSPHPKGKRD